MKKKNALGKIKKRIAVFIPTYNMAQTLPIVLDRIPKSVKEQVCEIFVADDASKDNTHLVGIGYRENEGLDKLKIYHHEKNKGYGGNQKWAYNYCIKNGIEIIIMLHGDAQYAPEKIPELLEPFKEDNPELGLVFGSRMSDKPLKGGMPLYKFVGNKALTWIENKTFGLNLSEYHSGYRVYSVKALKSIPFNLCDDGFHFDTEIIAMLKLANFKIIERPIATYYGEGARSNVRIFGYGFDILRVAAYFWLHKKGIRYSKKFDIKPEVSTKAEILKRKFESGAIEEKLIHKI